MRSLLIALGLLGCFPVRAEANSASSDPGLVANVDILQGTDSAGHNSRGNTLPLTGMPWGMVNWSIQNGDGAWYFHPTGKINGFRATHQPSPWIMDYGQFVLMPQSGELQIATAARTTDYDMGTALLRPDYEKLDLKTAGITVELTGTERCGVFRLNYQTANLGRLVLNTFGPGEIKIEGRNIYGISTQNRGGVSKNFASYFVIQLDRDMVKSEVVPPVVPPNSGKSHHQAKELDAYVEFKTSPDDPVLVKIGTSFISWKQAEQNLLAETSGSFEKVHDRVLATWNANLGKVTIEASDEQKRVFYSCLYRAQMFPHRLYEIDATGKAIHYSPYDGNIHDGVLYGDIGIWDAFRTTFPFITLIYPAQLSEILQGFVNAAKEGNGTLPEWPSPGYRRCMIGQHCAAIFADAAAKGITNFDLASAYESLRKSAFEPPTQGEMVRDGLADYLKLGYTPDTVRYSVSTTLDYAYDDWCVAQLALRLNHPEIAKTLLARAQNYRNLWDPGVGFMRAKNAEGQWIEPFDPFAWGGPYAESGPWQSSWFVPHDPLGLTGLLGGKPAFIAKLDQLFSLPPTFHYGGYRTQIHEMEEMSALNFGQCALNNQPSFSIPYLYAAIGEPAKTQYWTRRACAELFHATPRGFPGDEDNGSLASWYLFSSIGLYPFCPGSTQYLLTSPVFSKITLDLAGNKTLLITANGNSEKNVYIQRLKFNGAPVTKTWISHQQLINGGLLEFEMGPEPVTGKLDESDLLNSASPKE